MSIPIIRRLTNLLAYLLTAAALAVSATAFAQDAKPGEDFLKAVDTKHYAESWDVSSDLLKQSVSRVEWTSTMVKTRDPLGDVASRTLKSSVPQTNPQGAPPGEYLLVTYQTVFSSQGAPYTETLPLIKSPDGRWRAVGYFIR
jgi:hypothetical protein